VLSASEQAGVILSPRGRTQSHDKAPIVSSLSAIAEVDPPLSFPSRSPPTPDVFHFVSTHDRDYGGRSSGMSVPVGLLLRK